MRRMSATLKRCIGRKPNGCRWSFIAYQEHNCVLNTTSVYSPIFSPVASSICCWVSSRFINKDPCSDKPYSENPCGCTDNICSSHVCKRSENSGPGWMSQEGVQSNSQTDMCLILAHKQMAAIDVLSRGSASYPPQHPHSFAFFFLAFFPPLLRFLTGPMCRQLRQVLWPSETPGARSLLLPVESESGL